MNICGLYIPEEIILRILEGERGLYVRFALTSKTAYNMLNNTVKMAKVCKIKHHLRAKEYTPRQLREIYEYYKLDCEKVTAITRTFPDAVCVAFEKRYSVTNAGDSIKRDIPGMALKFTLPICVMIYYAGLHHI